MESINWLAETDYFCMPLWKCPSRCKDQNKTPKYKLHGVQTMPQVALHQNKNVHRQCNGHNMYNRVSTDNKYLFANTRFLLARPVSINHQWFSDVLLLTTSQLAQPIWDNLKCAHITQTRPVNSMIKKQGGCIFWMQMISIGLKLEW